jgi:WD40 repeat protein
LTLTHAPKSVRAIACVAVSRSGRLVAAGTHAGAITICDRSRSGSCRTVRVEDGVLNDLQFSPDERLLAVADENLRLLPMDPSEVSVVIRLDGQNYGTVRFSKAGTELLTITGRDEIQVIDLRSRASIVTICCSSIYGEVAFSPNGDLIFNAGHWPGAWDKHGHLLRRLTGDREEPTFGPIAIDEEMQTVFMGSQDGRVYAWSLQNYALLKRSDSGNEYVNTIAILKSIRKVAYCGFGKTLKLWDLDNGTVSNLAELRPSSNLSALSDGRSVLFGTANGTLETWDLGDTPRRTGWIAGATTSTGRR